MKNLTLDLYRQMFLSIKRGLDSQGNKSIAKPILLMSIIDLVPFIKQNRFDILDKKLQITYKSYCDKFEKNKTSPFIVPYYHMHKEPFYSLCWKQDDYKNKINHTPSIKKLSDLIDGAKLDDELWELLQNKENREYLKDCIIKNFLS